MTDQMMWDLDEMIAEVNPRPERPAWRGPAPLHFTTEFFTGLEFWEANDEWIEINGSFGSHFKSNCWKPAMTLGNSNMRTPDHDLFMVNVSLGCEHYRIECSCVTAHLYQAICEDCRWHAIGSESSTTEAWHDHAWPGWRDLPVIGEVQSGVDSAAQIKKLVTAADYPDAWKTLGAPVITQRNGIGTRHVPNRSPWGGYDISSTALERT